MYSDVSRDAVRNATEPDAPGSEVPLRKEAPADEVEVEVVEDAPAPKKGGPPPSPPPATAVEEEAVAEEGEAEAEAAAAAEEEEEAAAEEEAEAEAAPTKVERKWSPALTTLIMCLLAGLVAIVTIANMPSRYAYAETPSAWVTTVLGLVGPLLGIVAAVGCLCTDSSATVKRWPSVLLGSSATVEVACVVLSGFAVRGACAVALIKSAYRPGDIWTQQDNLPLLAINTLLAACCALNVLLLLRTRMLPPSKKGHPSCLPLAAAAIVAVAAVWGGVWLSLTAPSSMLLVEAGPDSAWLAPPLPPPGPSRHNYGGYGMNRNSYGYEEYHHPPSPFPPPSPPPYPFAAHLTVVSGPCVVSGQCVHSAHYPSYYGNNESCTLRPVRGQPLRVEAFATEESEDYLIINGVRYSGRMADDWGMNGGSRAPPHSIIPDRDITWSSDGSVSRSGWRICQESEQPHRPPPPPPSPGEVQPKRYEPVAAWYFHNANVLTGRGYSDSPTHAYDWAILCFVGNGAGGLGLLLVRLLRGRQRRQRTAAAAAAALSTVVDADAPMGAAGVAQEGRCCWLLQLGLALLLELGGVRPPAPHSQPASPQRCLPRHPLSNLPSLFLACTYNPSPRPRAQGLVLLACEADLLRWFSDALRRHAECHIDFQRSYSYNDFHEQLGFPLGYSHWDFHNVKCYQDDTSADDMSAARRLGHGPEGLVLTFWVGVVVQGLAALGCLGGSCLDTYWLLLELSCTRRLGQPACEQCLYQDCSLDFCWPRHLPLTAQGCPTHSGGGCLSCSAVREREEGQANRARVVRGVPVLPLSSHLKTLRPAAVRRHVSAAAAAGLPRGERGTAAVVVGYLHRGVVYKGPLRNGRGTCRCAVLCAAAARHCGGPTALRRGRSPSGPRRQQGVALHARVLRASPLCAGACYPQMPRAVQHAGAGCGCDDSDVQRAVVLGGGRAAVRGVRAGGTRLHLPQTAEQADRCYVRGKVPRRPAH